MSRSYARTKPGFAVQIYGTGYPTSGDSNRTSTHPSSGSISFTRSNIVKSSEWAKRALEPGIYVPPTGYSHGKTDFNVMSGTQTSLSGGDFVNSYGTIGPIFGGANVQLTTLPSTAVSHDMAIIKALEQLKDQDMNLSVSYAESSKTALHIASTMKTVCNAARKLKRGDYQGAYRELRMQPPSGKPRHRGEDVPKRWLEMQYGWKPLLGDVHGAAKAIAKERSNRNRISVKGVYTQGDVFAERSESGAGYELVEFSRSNARSSCRLDYICPDGDALITASQLGLINPFSVAWELVPFSFMIDWFMPIGRVLNVLDAALPYSFLGGRITDIAEIESKCMVYGTGPTYGDSFGSRYQYQSDRISLSMSPFPRFHFVPPHSESRGSKIFADTASIVSQVFG